MATTTQPPARTPRREATRARLMDAATEVFATMGFHAASIEDICARAGLTRGAFYSNFTNKDDLLLQVYALHIDRLVARAKELATRTDLRPAQILEGFFDAWARSPLEAERLYLLQVECAMQAIRDSTGRREWTALQQRMVAELSRVVDDLVVRRGLRIAVPTADFIRFAIAVHTGGMAAHLLEPRAVSRRAIERALLPLLMPGTASDAVSRR